MEFSDILPADPKTYDKMRPPNKDGLPTSVFFHVTVMGQFQLWFYILNYIIKKYFKYLFLKKGLDSIDENSMTYAADIFFAQTWKDHRLRLPGKIL